MVNGKIKRTMGMLSSIKRLLLDNETKTKLQCSLNHTACKPNFLKIYQHLASMESANQFNQFCLKSSHEELSSFLDNKVTISNFEYWKQVYQFDGPVIFVTPHYGPFTIGCLKAVLDMGEEKTINAFYDPPEKNPTTAIYKDVLSSLGENFNPIFNDSRGLVRALKRLKNNEILTMMPDVFDLSGQSISIPFLGHFTTAMGGTAFLALKTNALIMQAYCVPTKDGGVHCILDKPFQHQATNDFDQDVFDLTSKLFESIEHQINIAPEHWIYLRQLDNRLGLPLPESKNFMNSKNKALAVMKSLNLDSSAIEEAFHAYGKN